MMCKNSRMLTTLSAKVLANSAKTTQMELTGKKTVVLKETKGPTTVFRLTRCPIL
jgi:hypothetical protein